VVWNKQRGIKEKKGKELREECRTSVELGKE